MQDKNQFEVIIIGGSYAGLSAAMALGRMLRRVLIIDSGLPCNRQTPHAHNFMTHDGAKPSAIAEQARAELLQYSTLHFLQDLAIEGKKIDDTFCISTQSGQEFRAQQLIVATGIKDEMPDIKGFEACWGISVIHCPYCHGYEWRQQKTGILANGERAFHLASMIHQLSDNSTILTRGKADFDANQLATLHQRQINIIESDIAEIVHEKGYVQQVIFEDGTKEHFSALYAGIPFTQHCAIPVSLGCELTDQGHIKVNPFQATSVAGVYACGDNAAMMRSLATAVYTGNLCGAMVNKALTEAQF